MSDGELPARFMVQGTQLQIISDIASVRNISMGTRLHDDFVADAPKIQLATSVGSAHKTSSGIRRAGSGSLGKVMNDAYKPFRNVRGLLGDLTKDADISQYLVDKKGVDIQDKLSVKTQQNGDYVKFLNPSDSIYNIVIKRHAGSRGKDVLGRWNPWEYKDTVITLQPGQSYEDTLKQKSNEDVDIVYSLTDMTKTTAEVQKEAADAKAAADQAATDAALKQQLTTVQTNPKLTTDQKNQQVAIIQSQIAQNSGTTTINTALPMTTQQKNMVIGGIVVVGVLGAIAAAVVGMKKK